MSEMFNIVKGHPIPPITRTRPTTSRKKYPIEGMDVGDSFFVAGRTVRRVSAYISRITKALTGKFETRPGWGRQQDGNWLPAEAEAAGATEGTWVWRTK
jgi:hypothetical protein